MEEDDFHEVKTARISKCSVTNPQKYGKAPLYYLGYTVASDSVDGTSFSTVRRYSDFEWLRGVILRKNSHAFVPPLPPKALMNRFGPPEWVEERRAELDNFLNELLIHPIYSLSVDLTQFCILSEQSFRMYITTQPKSNFNINSNNLIRRATIGTTTMVDPWSVDEKEYLVNISSCLLVLKKVSKSNIKYIAQMELFYKEFVETTQALEQLDKGTPELSVLWEKWTTIYNSIMESQKQIMSTEKQLKRFIKISKSGCDTAMGLIESCPNVQKASLEFCDVDENKGTGSVSSMELTSSKIKNELENFKSKKAKDTRKALQKYISDNLQHQKHILSLWQDLLLFLDTPQ